MRSTLLTSIGVSLFLAAGAAQAQQQGLLVKGVVLCGNDLDEQPLLDDTITVAKSLRSASDAANVNVTFADSTYCTTTDDNIVYPIIGKAIAVEGGAIIVQLDFAESNTNYAILPPEKAKVAARD